MILIEILIAVPLGIGAYLYYKDGQMFSQLVNNRTSLAMHTIDDLERQCQRDIWNYKNCFKNLAIMYVSGLIAFLFGSLLLTVSAFILAGFYKYAIYESQKARLQLQSKNT